jgi:hypothetical protein
VKAAFNVDQTVDANGNVREQRSPLSSESQTSVRSARADGHRIQANAQPENGNIFNPAAAITRILAMKDVSAERISMTDPATGSPREGILLATAANSTAYLARQVWFFSKDSKLPQEVITYAPNPKGGPAVVDTTLRA